MSRENVALARRWFQEVWNQRRAATIDELLHPQSVCHADVRGLAAPGGKNA